MRSRKYLKITVLLLGVALLITMFSLNYVTIALAGENKELTQEDFLHTSGKEIRTNAGETVLLKGTNAGGWLLQEFWMTLTEESTNVKAELDLYSMLTKRFGMATMQQLIKLYQDNYWTEQDFVNCQDLGINCIRLPFWYRNLVDENGQFYGYDATASDPYSAAFSSIDWFIEKAGEYGIYVILDFHGAPGSQNGSDHSGVDGGDDKQGASEFFFGENVAGNQELFYQIWEVIAARYAGNPAVAGYDLLNEPFSSYRYSSSYTASALHSMLWKVYDTAYDRIRAIDSEHIIIMEGIWRPSDLPNPSTYGWENIMYEYHSYNFDDVDNTSGGQIATLKNMLYAIDYTNYNVPSYIGEFTLQNSIDAWDTGLSLLNDKGISWTTWTYKTADYYGNWGLYHHIPNSQEVNAETSSLNQIKTRWSKVGESVENTELTSVIKKYCMEEVTQSPEVTAAPEETVSPSPTETPDESTGDTSDITYVRVEAEEALLYGSAVLESKGIYSNRKAVSISNGSMVADEVLVDWSNIGYMKLEYEAQKAGVYQVVLYCIGQCNKDILVMGIDGEVQEFQILRNKGDAWDTVYAQEVNLYLKEGINEIYFSGTLGSSTSWINYDYIDISSEPIQGTEEEEPEKEIEYIKIEAEEASLYGEAVLEGKGIYSNKKAVSISNGDMQFSEILEDWSNISYMKLEYEVLIGGTYRMELACVGQCNKDILVKTGGGVPQEFMLLRNKGEAWDTVYTQEVYLELEAGINEIYFSGTINNSSAWVNYDYIIISSEPIK